MSVGRYSRKNSGGHRVTTDTHEGTIKTMLPAPLVKIVLNSVEVARSGLLFLSLMPCWGYYQHLSKKEVWLFCCGSLDYWLVDDVAHRWKVAGRASDEFGGFLKCCHL